MRPAHNRETRARDRAKSLPNFREIRKQIKKSRKLIMEVYHFMYLENKKRNYLFYINYVILILLLYAALGILDEKSNAHADGGFTSGFANALSEGIKQRDRQRHERELLELQLKQRERELEIQRQIEANRLKQLEIIEKQSPQSQPREEYMIDNVSRINNNLYIMHNAKIIVETQYCDYEIKNEDSAVDLRNENSMTIFFIEKSILCTIIKVQ